MSEVLEIIERQTKRCDGRTSEVWWRRRPPKRTACRRRGCEGSGDELADTAGGPDATLCDGGELFGADNARDLGELALAENLEVALQEIVYYLIKKNLQPW